MSFPAVAARYWDKSADGRVRCRLCHRFCRMREGQRGACYVRAVRDNRLVLTTYGRMSGAQIDPIEKKPLYHFHPGSTILSFGSIGCNLACRFCQNHHLSNCRTEDALATWGDPEGIAASAKEHGCSSVAFTYNDPIPSLEFVVDVAQACRRQGIATVAVTNGYLSPEAHAEFFGAMDAANIDLKAFSDGFYRRNCAAHLQPVLETLEYVRNSGRTWLEITTLLIPGENDSEAEIAGLAEWIVGTLGPDVPLHLSAFHPSWKMVDRPRTPKETLVRARRLALEAGLRYVYTGNVHDPEGSTTSCSACGHLLIRRSGYETRISGMASGGRCAACGAVVPGVGL